MLVIGMKGLFCVVVYGPREVDVPTSSANGNVPVMYGLRLLHWVSDADTGMSDDDKTNLAYAGPCSSNPPLFL